MAVKMKGLGYVTVTAAGTAVPLSASSIISAGCMIQAATTNTGLVFVGGSNLSGVTGRASELSPGTAVEIVGPAIRGIEEEIDLADIRVDAANSGDKVVVTYFTRSV